MRKNSFNIQKLKLFEKQNRGTGILSEYIPYHLVSRSDPSSIGRSRRNSFNNRIMHLLSTEEYVAMLFATMHKDLYDIREQFPLKQTFSKHESNDYIDGYGSHYPGTLDIAKNLGIKHPVIKECFIQVNWVITTDLLIVLKTDTKIELIAVACKKNYPSSPRKIELLRIEKAYWEARNVKWLLITPDLYERDYYNLLRAHKPKLNKELFDHSLLHQLIDKIKNHPCSYSDLYKEFLAKGYEGNLITNTFWTGFWYAEIPLDFKVVFEPLKQISLISKEEFLVKNPIYSWRTSWI